jgi:hypothetical protein
MVLYRHDKYNKLRIFGKQYMKSQPKLKNYYKIVKNSSPKTVADNEYRGLAKSSFSHYQSLMRDIGSRQSKYNLYDMMDDDVIISSALDLLSEEITGNRSKTDDPIIIEYKETSEELTHNTIKSLEYALQQWVDIHEWRTRMFPLVRNVLKYGDCIFKKDGNIAKWIPVPIRSVKSAILNKENEYEVLGWYITKDSVGDFGSTGDGGYTPVGGANTGTNDIKENLFTSTKVVRFSLNSDFSEMYPFGESVLKAIRKVHIQKKFLEDAIVIYRIQRAPERRVFYIDTGTMPAPRAKKYLQTIKDEIRQKKVPVANVNNTKGVDEMESLYNPTSMQEDFFFAQGANGKGSRVETLPGGQSVGETNDLDYFVRKELNGLRIPQSYIRDSSEGGAIFSDGRLGQAYIEELRFSLYVERLQFNIEKILDEEFKKFLREVGIRIDPNLFKLTLPPPSNFGKYREQELDSALLNSFSTIDGVEYMSKRFLLSRYLKLSEAEIVKNENMKLEEMGYDPENLSDEERVQAITTIYSGSVESGMDDMDSGMDDDTEDFDMTP